MTRRTASQRPFESFTNDQIRTLLSMGRKESRLVSQMKQAVKAGDKEKVWELAKVLIRVSTVEVKNP